jgi:hypothetical protein
MSIIDVSRKCPNIMNNEKVWEEDKKKLLVWERDKDQMASIVSVPNQPVTDFVLTYNDAKDIWDKYVIVYEKSSIQRLCLLMTVLQASAQSRNGHCCYVAVVEKLFSDMYTELSWQGLHDIPIQLLHGQMLATMRPDYQDFSNIQESFEEKWMTKSAWETVYNRKTVADIDDSSGIKCTCGTCVNHVASTGVNQNNIE